MKRLGAHFEFLDEAFDKPYPYKLIRVDKDEYVSEFKADDGTFIKVMFAGSEHVDDYDEYDWEIVFQRMGKSGKPSMEVTGEGDAMRIFATVIKVIGEFIKKENPKYMNLMAEKKGQSGDVGTTVLQSREKLYKRMLTKFLGSKYKIDQRTARFGSVFYLKRKK
jgi:hypothetical protein